MTASPSIRFYKGQRLASVLLLAGLCGAASRAEEPKLPVGTDDKGSVYVAPKVSSSEKSVEAHGATVGVQRKDGSSLQGGVDASTERPTYSVGGSTGGNTSFSASAESDGKASHGVKAGIQIRY